MAQRAIVSEVPADWPIPPKLRDNWNAYIKKYPTFGFPQENMTFFVWFRDHLRGFAEIEDVVYGSVYGSVVMQPSANVEVTYKKVSFVPRSDGSIVLKDDTGEDLMLCLLTHNEYDFDVIPSDIPALVDADDDECLDTHCLPRSTVSAIRDFMQEILDNTDDVKFAEPELSPEDCAELICPGCPRHPPTAKSSNDLRQESSVPDLQQESKPTTPVSDNNDDDIFTPFVQAVTERYPEAEYTPGLRNEAYQAFGHCSALKTIMDYRTEFEPMILKFDIERSNGEWRLHSVKEAESDVIIRVVRVFHPQARYVPGFFSSMWNLSFQNAFELRGYLEKIKFDVHRFNVVMNERSSFKWTLYVD